jgi:3-methyl-2-oxobutanoate hydroxymethyltransferase
MRTHLTPGIHPNDNHQSPAQQGETKPHTAQQLAVKTAERTQSSGIPRPNVAACREMLQLLNPRRRRITASPHHPALASASYNQSTMPALTKKTTLADLRSLRTSGKRLAMLTCYDYTTARMMHEAGVPLILVGDSAASVILGYDTTLPVSLAFMMEITAAVRRGAPNAFLVADMPFGSYHASLAQGIRNVARMVKRTGCDAVKLEVAESTAPLVRSLADAGVAVVCHLGLKPQAVGLLGGYRFQGRTSDEARQIVASSLQMQDAGAAAILLEAVPPEVARVVVEKTYIPVIGCGAGPSCHSSVIVTQDALGLTPYRPRFVPALADHATPLKAAFEQYVQAVAAGSYPASEHEYIMPPAEKEKFVAAEAATKVSSTGY